jgi:putative transposase
MLTFFQIDDIFIGMATYHSQNHSKYLLQVHLVFSTKYRKKILTGSLSDDLKQIMYDIANEKDITIVAMDTDIDHIHLMVDYPPKKSVLEMVNNFKSISTFRIYKKHKAFLKSHYWAENTLFSDGYFSCSIGEASPETIKKYIQTQG